MKTPSAASLERKLEKLESGREREGTTDRDGEGSGVCAIIAVDSFDIPNYGRRFSISRHLPASPSSVS